MRPTLRRMGWAVACVGLALTGAVRCVNVDRGLGDACERNEDCQSGVCAGAICVPQPPLLTSIPPLQTARDAGGSDGSADGSDDGGSPPDAGGSTDSGDGADTGTPLDAAADAGVDARMRDAGSTPDGGSPKDSGSLKDSGSPKDCGAHHPG